MERTNAPAPAPTPSGGPQGWERDGIALDSQPVCTATGCTRGQTVPGRRVGGTYELVLAMSVHV